MDPEPILILVGMLLSALFLHILLKPWLRGGRRG